MIAALSSISCTTCSISQQCSLVSVLATNRSYLLMRTLLRFVGFHRQPSLGLLRGLLYLEVCKTRSASGIELEIMTFRKSSLYFFFEPCSFFGKRKIYFCPALSVPICHSHSISRHRPRKSSTLLRACKLLLRRLRLFVSSGVSIPRASLCVLLTHVCIETSLKLFYYSNQGIIDSTGMQSFAKLAKSLREIKSMPVRHHLKVHWFFSYVCNPKFSAFWCFAAA